MDVTRYIFQSPYSSQIQIGRPDVNSSKNEGDSELIKSTNKSMNDAKIFQAAQKQEVKASVDSSLLLDVTV